MREAALYQCLPSPVDHFSGLRRIVLVRASAPDGWMHLPRSGAVWRILTDFPTLWGPQISSTPPYPLHPPNKASSPSSPNSPVSPTGTIAFLRSVKRSSSSSPVCEAGAVRRRHRSTSCSRSYSVIAVSPGRKDKRVGMAVKMMFSVVRIPAVST